MPEMVRGYVPATVDLVDVKVSVEVPEVVIEAGEKLAVTPVGRLEAPRVTLPVNPFVAAIVAVNEAEFPAVMLCTLGDMESEKSAVLLVVETVKATSAACVSVPLAPLTVSEY